MIIYAIVFIILGGLATLSSIKVSRNARIAITLAAAIILTLFAGLRKDTGNDWNPYEEYYQSLHTIHDKSADFELGYRATSLVIKLSGVPYPGFLILYTAIYIGIFTLAFNREGYRDATWLLFLLYSSYLLGWMGTARQVLAIAICVYSLRYIRSREYLKFLFAVSIASLFHTTALIFLIAWPLDRIQLRRTALMLIVFGAVACGLAGAGETFVNLAGSALHISYLQEKINFYTALSVQDLGFQDSSLSVLWYLKRVLTFCFFMFFFARFKTEDEQLYMKLYVFSIVLFVVFMKSIPMLPLRAGLYFSIFELFLLVALIPGYEYKWSRRVYIVFLVLIAFVRLTSSLFAYHPELYIPYKSIWLNQEMYRGMH